MNPTTLTVIIAASAFIISIFAANWLNLRSNDRLFERLDKQLAAQFGEVRAEFGAVRAEIGAVRTEITALRAEMTARFSALENKVDRLDRQMEAIFKPVLPKS